jgi:5-methylcytosine-specific restriction endonuclease McrA
MRYCIDLFTSKKKLWMYKYDFKEVNNQGNTYYTIKVDKYEKNKIIRKAKWRGIKYRCYEERWSRSSDYRRKFIKVYKAPYRCRYCNRKLKEEDMVVDHVIPVAKVKKNKNHARLLLKIKGIEDVNDLKNLVASCDKCNGTKRDKMGIWLIKAWIGKFDFYWKIKPIITLIFWGIICYYLYKNEVFTILLDIVQKFISF